MLQQGKEVRHDAKCARGMGGSREMDLERALQSGEAVEGQSSAVLQHTDHSRGAGLVPLVSLSCF